MTDGNKKKSSKNSEMQLNGDPSKGLLGQAEDLLVETSKDTKRKILVSLNLSISIPVMVYFFSRLFGQGFPVASRDVIVYPVVMMINLSSALFGLYHLFRKSAGSKIFHGLFSWSSILILQAAAIVFVNFTTAPTNSFIFANAIPIIGIVVTGLVLNRWVAVIYYFAALGSVWLAASRIGFDFVYVIYNPVLGEHIRIPLTLYIVLYHLLFTMTIFIIFFESGTIGRIVGVIPSVIDRIREASAEQRQLEDDNLRMSTELDVAQRLQLMVLPSDEEKGSLYGLDIAARMDPADEVGGDFYDIIKKDDGVYFAIGDVTGHGLASGVVMLMAQSALSMALDKGSVSMQAVLSSMNSVLYHNINTRMNTNLNMTFALLRYSDGIIKICGQHEKVLIKRAGGPVEQINTIDLGLYIGLTDDIGFSLKEIDIPLNMGDAVLLYTDGATEAENSDEEEFGTSRLAESFERHCTENYSAAESLENVRADISKWISGKPLQDDISLLIFIRKE